MKKLLPKDVSRYGFTLTEVLIIIMVLGMLFAFVINIYSGAQHRARVIRAQTDLTTIKKAMVGYKSEIGELPPEGDWWTYGTDPPSEDAWRPVLEDMEAEKYLGPHLVDQLVKDPWGRAYGYDDNDCNSWADAHDPTYLQSYGPNGRDDEPNTPENDDISVRVSDGCPY